MEYFLLFLSYSRSMAMKTSICYSPDCQLWATQRCFQHRLFNNEQNVLTWLWEVLFFTSVDKMSSVWNFYFPVEARSRCCSLFLRSSCFSSLLCRITMESHSLALRQLCLAEMGASPTTPIQVTSQSLVGTTPPLQRPPPAWLPHSLPRPKAKDIPRLNLSLLRPSLNLRASRSITAASRPFCRQATATQGCRTTPECRAPCPALPPSSTVPPCSFLLEARDQLQLSSTVWAWAWGTPQPAPFSSRRSSSPAATASTPSAQVYNLNCNH